MIGFYEDLPNEEYHSSPGISKSGLMMINKSPKHYYDRYLSPDRQEQKPTDAMRLGSLAHCFLLEPIKIKERYAIMPKIDLRTKEGKLEKDAFIKESEGKEVTTQDEHDQARDMTYSVFENKTCEMLFKSGENLKVESSIYFNDVELDVLCKCRPDLLTDNYILDFKTTQDASEESFSREIYQYGYHIQAAMMQEGCHSIGMGLIKDFFFVCVEKKEPYYTAVYRLSDEAIAKGREDFRRLLKVYKECMESGEWNGYAIKEIGLPRWVR